MSVTVRYARLIGIIVACLLLLGLVMPPRSAAQGPARSPARPRLEGLVLPDLNAVPLQSPRPAVRTYDALRSQALAARPILIIVALSEPAAVSAAPLNASASQAQIARVASAQQRTETALQTAGIPYRVVFAPQRVFSGLVIEAELGQIDAIRQLPGVVDAYPAGIGTVANSSSVPFLGTPPVWANGYRGQGVRIGVIDTGIDYEHADFGGTGPGTGFPTAKVAGGYDFVGDTWDPVTNPVLNPDSDPMDQDGHGTHMAGTIAGYGVDGTGSTYPGPWNTTTPFGSMIIGPGMAPEATLYALKVGSANGIVSEAATIAALEWAVDPNGDGDLSDHLDVVNLALGTEFGDLDRGWSVAADNAAQAGIIVVAAAGNLGDTYFIQIDPATAPHVISVGQSNDGDNGGPAADTLGASSARGPQRNPNAASIALKPDIIAPGINIVSADAGTVNGGVSTGPAGGTSSATSHVAGMMALLRQAYPGWSVSDLKALVMNTATHDLYSGNNFTPPIYGPARVGAGRVDAGNAFDSEVIAYNSADPELVSVSFGLLNVAAAATFQKTITVENMGSTSQTYDVAYVPVVYADDGSGPGTPGVGDGGPGVVTSVSPAQITVGPGSTETVTVTLAVDPALMVQPYTHDPTVREVPLFFRHWLAEEAGYVTLTPTGAGTLLRVPVYAAPRPAATMSATSPTLPVAGLSGTASIALTGTDVYTGPNIPYDETSIVSTFALWSTSPALAGLSGFQPSADLENIGVASNYLLQGSNLGTTRVYFGLSTVGEWSSLTYGSTTFEVYLDVDQDSFADYRLIILGFGLIDSPVTYVEDLTSGALTLQWLVNNFIPSDALNFPDTMLFQSNVVTLPLNVSSLPELVPGDARFDFWVAGYYKNELIDLSDVMTYDVEAAGIDLASSAPYALTTMFDDWNGAAVDLAYDWTQYIGPSPACVLLLHHHNVSGSRPESVCFQPDIVSDLSITKTVDDETPDPGDTVIYTITAVNNAATAAPMVLVDDLLPDGVTYVSHTVTQGSYSPFSGLWIVEALAPAGDPAATATLTITATVNAGASGTITNIATIRASVGVDATPANNTARATLDLTGETPPADGGTGAGESALPTVAPTGEALILPATGYPPQAEPASESAFPLWGVALLGLVAGVLVIGVAWWRAMR